MSQNEIPVIIELNEIPIIIEDPLSFALIVPDLLQDVNVWLNKDNPNAPQDVDVLVNLDDLTRIAGPITLHGIISKAFAFNRITTGNKKTYGQIAFIVTLNRVTSGFSSGASTRTYGAGTYGEGSYGADIATYIYGSGTYGEGTYG